VSEIEIFDLIGRLTVASWIVVAGWLLTAILEADDE
jgi:hypothetical protein